MGEPGATRIQLCGRLVVELDGRRIEDALPGAKGRLLFAYLVLNRHRRMSRDELLTAVYGEEASPDQHPSLSVLLSKLRSVIGQEHLVGRSEIELMLPADAFLDVEAAREALQRRGNVAEALRAYDRLRVLLRDELGIAPSPVVQSVHRRLLGERTTTS